MVVPSLFVRSAWGARVEDKVRLRARMREARRKYVEALPSSTRALILMRPPAPLLDLVPEGITVGLYHATVHEAPTTGYARWLYENGRRIALPWFADRTAPMTFREWGDPFDGSDLVEGPFGPQPSPDSSEVVPQVAIVPLVAFTAHGDRLGQGGGHYDRWLGAHPDAIAMGLAWDMQLVDALPVESHDRGLTAVITPTRLYRSEA